MRRLRCGRRSATAFCGVARFHPAQHFAGEREIRVRALRLRLELERRDAVRRRLGEAHVARNDRAIELVAEMLLELGRDVLRERVARIVHRAQQALDLEPRVEVRAHLLDRLDEIGKSFERVVLALHRDQHRVGRAQPVERQQRQRRRAVEQDEIVVGGDSADRRRASGAALRRARPSAASRARAGRPARPRRRRARGSRARGRSRPDGDCDAHVGDRASRRAAPGRRCARSARLSMPAPVVALPCGSRSTSSTRRFIAARLAARLTVGRRLADAALLVGDGDDAGHRGLSPRAVRRPSHDDQVALRVEPRHVERGRRRRRDVARAARAISSCGYTPFIATSGPSGARRCCAAAHEAREVRECARDRSRRTARRARNPRRAR